MKILAFSIGVWFLAFAFPLCFAQEFKPKKVIMVIAKSNFRDEELEVPKSILQQSGIEVTIASSSLRTAKGMLGLEVEPDISVEEIELENYDALIFVGGTGAKEYWFDSEVYKIINDAFISGKVLGAICIAPVTLANAGILKDRKATVWSSEADKLKVKGAIYTGSAVETDGTLITANGPDAAKGFAEAIKSALLKIAKPMNTNYHE